MNELGVYLHFPFCVRKCAYCDFNSQVAGEALRERYRRALVEELQRQDWRTGGQGDQGTRGNDNDQRQTATAPPAAGQAGSLSYGTTDGNDNRGLETAPTNGTRQGRQRVTSIYLGGGTPTIYSPEEIGEVLEKVRAAYEVEPEAEISCEANPGTVDEDSLGRLRAAGVNRLRLGVQSFREEELALLGRIHTAQEAREAAVAARQAGFENLSLDLIRGLPGQTLAQWRKTLEQTVALEPDHISAYGLTLEPGTPLAELAAAGKLTPLEEEPAVEIFLATHETLTAAGYEHYEIANYARPAKQCRHNLIYWHNREYLGHGAGAWSYLGGVRRRNIADPTAYSERVERGKALTAESECLSAAEALGETIMLGLRLAEGIDPVELGKRFGVELPERYRQAWEWALETGLLQEHAGRWRPTLKGMLLNNELGTAFV